MSKVLEWPWSAPDEEDFPPSPKPSKDTPKKIDAVLEMQNISS